MSTPRPQRAIELHAIGVPHAGSSEEIQCAADGQIHSAAADLLDAGEVVEGAGPAGVGRGQRRSVGQARHEFFVDSPAQAFHIDGVDEELGAEISQARESLGTELDLGELLPPIGDDPVSAVANPATQVEDQTLASDSVREFPQARPIHLTVPEYPGSDDDVRRTRIEPDLGVGGIDAAAILKTARPGCQGVPSRRVIPRTQRDDMTAPESVVAIATCEPRGRLRRFKVGLDAFAGIGERSAHDLDDAPIPQVDARSEHEPSVRKERGRIPVRSSGFPQSVRRRVALKVIKLGMDTKSVVARFEAERQALAMMDHPNIAKVLDAGATDPYRPAISSEDARDRR